MFAKRIEREIKHINNYENKWKIKTTTQKFTLLPIATRKMKPVTIDGKNIQYASEAIILGLKLRTRGFTKHVKDLSNKAQIALKTIRRFDALNTNIKVHLAKSRVIPILTYRTYALNSITKSLLLSLQGKQNKALRFV